MSHHRALSSLLTPFSLLPLFSLLLGVLPSPAAGQKTAREPAQPAPDETGHVPVLLYHHIGPEDTRWTRTPEGLRRDLELLHSRGYRPVSVADYAAGRVDLPRGRKPVIITFDDASPGQFRYLPRSVEGSDTTWATDPRSAVGVFERFAAENPEWKGGLTFCLLAAADAGNSFFGANREGGEGHPQRHAKVRHLAESGYELCNHTWYHARLDRLDDEDVQEHIARGQLAIDSAVAGPTSVPVLALPLGQWPSDSTLAVRGEWTNPVSGDTVRYRHAAVLLAAGDPAPSPYAPRFDPLGIPRLQVIGDNLQSLIEQVERLGVYISDGEPQTVTRTSAHSRIQDDLQL